MKHEVEAVLLAAGRGTRLSARTHDCPKSLLPIGPRTLVDPTETSFLRRQCELLREVGVDRIVVVISYLKEMMQSAIDSWNLGVKTVENSWPNVSESGSLHSFQYAMRSPLSLLDGTRQTLLLDADIVYARRALEVFLAARDQTSLLICPRCADDSEEVRVFGQPDHPKYLGKGLTPNLVERLPCLGEATGIVKFAPRDHLLVRETVNWMLGDPDAPEGSMHRAGFAPARRGTEHEELTQRFMRYGRMASVMLAADVPFMECDNSEEYARVREVLYPALLQEEARQ